MDEHGIDFIAHDTEPYKVPGVSDCYQEMKEVGRFLPTLRTKSISTSDILTRILKNRRDLFERNLKKGYGRKDLNLNYLEYFYIQLRKVMIDVKRCLDNVKQDL